MVTLAESLRERRRASVLRHLEHPAVGEVADRLAVGREEGRVGVLGAGQLPGFECSRDRAPRDCARPVPCGRRTRSCSRRGQWPATRRNRRAAGWRSRGGGLRSGRLAAAMQRACEASPRCSDRDEHRRPGRSAREEARVAPGRAGRADASPALVRVPLPSSASLNSFALPQRSAGSFCSAVSTACSTMDGTVFRRRMMDAGSSVITFATMDCAVGPVKGASPVSISYVTAPSAYTSLRGRSPAHPSPVPGTCSSAFRATCRSGSCGRRRPAAWRGRCRSRRPGPNRRAAGCSPA